MKLNKRIVFLLWILVFTVNPFYFVYSQKIKIEALNDSMNSVIFKKNKIIIYSHSIFDFSPDSLKFAILDFKEHKAKIYQYESSVIDEFEFKGNDISISNENEYVTIEKLISENIMRRCRLKFFDGSGTLKFDSLFGGGLTAEFLTDGDLVIAQSSNLQGLRIPGHPTNILLINSSYKVKLNKNVPYELYLNDDVQFDKLKNEYIFYVKSSNESQDKRRIRFDKSMNRIE